MKQKTAIRQLIEKLKDIEMLSEKPSYSDGLKSAIFFAMELEPLNKQQIIDFHVRCVDDGAMEENEVVSDADKILIKDHAVKFFNETFEKP